MNIDDVKPDTRSNEQKMLDFAAVQKKMEATRLILEALAPLEPDARMQTLVGVLSVIDDRVAALLHLTMMGKQ